MYYSTVERIQIIAHDVTARGAERFFVHDYELNGKISKDTTPFLQSQLQSQEFNRPQFISVIDCLGSFCLVKANGNVCSTLLGHV